jgi:hypothetical protein
MFPYLWTKVTVPGMPGEHLLSTWLGGYTQGDSWRLSTRIVKEELTPQGFVFTTESGSTYTCNPNARGMNHLSESIARKYKLIEVIPNEGKSTEAND